ncbi:MAG: hypothetical protein KAV82_05015 [Phycisphaerae bacterium]|nr:hypothetical protein [Phycisphaerae bacterium]
MFRLRRALVAIAIVLLAGQYGCKTDPLFENRQKVDGPVTSIQRPEGVEVADIVIVDAREVDLVEEVLTLRAKYYRSLETLRDYYKQKGYHRKQQWAEYELEDVEHIHAFKYLLDAEIPVSSLRPTDSIPQADALYTKGLELMKQGGHKVPALYRKDLMVEALGAFTELITRFPASDKIDDAAFYCGEIHKEYFKNQEEIALKWYERAWTWDPHTPHPARFQAAVVYDYRLHDRARALELYHEVLKCEAKNKSNAAFAVTRIHFLTGDLKSAGADEVGAEQ